MGLDVISLFYPQGFKDLQVSLFQALVLMLFNDKDRLSFEEIKSACNIEVGPRTISLTLFNLF